jgi:hypothetical protein
VKQWRLLLTLFALVTIPLLATPRAFGETRGGAMQGPDFDLARISDWDPDTAGMAHLSLMDGTRWTMPISDVQYAAARQAIELARRLDRPVFVSGNKRTGRFDRVALPAPLVPAEVAPEPVDGKLRVRFHGPPSFYYLHTDRPWFNQARRLLLDTLRKETATTFAPQLLVTVDIVNLEIMDVRVP